MLRFHTQTAGVQLTAQQPEVNLVRVTLQALAAVLGGTQSLHTNSFDEAIALPTAKAARLALRTQQVLAHETDLTKTVDPFAGSYAVESLTDDLEAAIRDADGRPSQERGGAVAAIEQGFQKPEIERAAYAVAAQIDDGERVVVGVNRFALDAGGAVRAAAGRPGDRGGPDRAAGRAAAPTGTARRWTPALRARPRAAAAGTDNVLPPLQDGTGRDGPPSARSATPSARSGGPTGRPTLLARRPPRVADSALSPGAGSVSVQGRDDVGRRKHQWP